MLVAQIQTMQTLLEARAQLRDKKKTLDRLTEQEDRLKKIVVTYEDRICLAQKLDPSYAKSEIARSVRTALKGVTRRYSQSKVLTREDTVELEDKLRILVNSLKAQWQVKQAELVNEALLSQIDIVRKIGSSNAQSELNTLYEKITKVRQQDLPRAADYDEIIMDINQVKQVIARALPAMTPEIQVFLERLINKRAKLRDVTPEVLEWCRRERLLDWISLSIGV
jgi:hypothetical protein